MDRELHPFATLRTTGVADENGDRVFDEEELPQPPALPAEQVISLTPAR